MFQTTKNRKKNITSDIGRSCVFTILLAILTHFHPEKQTDDQFDQFGDHPHTKR